MAENCSSGTSAAQDGQEACCCGPKEIGPIDYRAIAVVAQIDTPKGRIDVLSSRWRLKDYLGAAGVRIGINRMNYAVAPGLYAVGRPDAGSPVIVSCNYKLSFDILRRELSGLNVWLLVIDTKGVNVWCAAGKGTFGTMEVSRRAMMTGLADIVSHTRLILPQLAAPGVAAHIVKAFAGFDVAYGPVRAKDIPRFIADGFKASPAMRRVRFTLIDRVVVSLMEVSLALKAALFATALLFLSGTIDSHGFSLSLSWGRTGIFIVALWIAVFSGTVLTAAFLPFLPGRAFSLRGGVLGFIAGVFVVLAAGRGLPALSMASLLCMATAVSAWLALNFTGSSTFTSLSGVKKEISVAAPVLISLTAVAVILFIAGRIIS
jgi:hypothetical protein